MTRNQLPEGVGKKIVEALKRQAEADITPMEENNNIITNSLPLTDIEDIAEGSFNALPENDMIIEEDTTSTPLGFYQEKEEPVVVPTPIPVPVQEKVVEPAANFQPSQSFHFEEPQISKEPVKPAKTFGFPATINLPANVTILKNLIANLPVGVTKQTGAQIIRQTLEAMGIPMNSVLKEAQEIQEELNISTRECLLKIQEYKTNILQLEQSVQEYQKNTNQINDLVSLFLLTDKNN